jgi:hypothetical protein
MTTDSIRDELLWEGMGEPPADFYEHPEYAEPEEVDEPLAERQPVQPRGEGATPLVAGAGYARRFPIEHLPPKMRQYAIDIAARKQVPIDLTALTMLGVLAGVMAPRIVIRRDTDWVEPTNLYVLTGMDSGAAKSPAVSEIRAGLWIAHQKMKQRHETSVIAQTAQMQADIELMRTKAKNGMTPLPEREGLLKRIEHAEKAMAKLAEAPPAAPVIALDGDTTPEALAQKMASNGGQGTVIDDEGTLLRNLGGQYSGGKTSNLGVVLKGYDCSPYNPTRVTRDTGTMDRAALSICITPQPGLVADMLRNNTMSETGLINRFVVSLPGDLVGKRENRASVYIDDTISTPKDVEMKKWWADLLGSIVEYEPITDQHSLDEDLRGFGGPVIDLTREAYKLHLDWACAFEKRMDASRNGDLSRVRGWASKHPGRVLRFAAALHFGHGMSTDDRCPGRIMKAAIAAGDWAIEHFLAAGRVVGLSEGAGRIKEFIDGTDLFMATRTAINVEVFKKNVAAAQLDTWVDELIATGEYEQVVIPTDGRSKTVIKKVGSRSKATLNS